MFPRWLVTLAEQFASRVQGDDTDASERGSTSTDSDDNNLSLPISPSARHVGDSGRNPFDAQAKPVTASEVNELEVRIADCDRQLSQSEVLLQKLDNACQRLLEEVEVLMMESFDAPASAASSGERMANNTRIEGGEASREGKAKDEGGCSPDSPALWNGRAAMERQRHVLLADMLSKRDRLVDRVYKLRIGLETLRTRRRRVTKALNVLVSVDNWDGDEDLPLPVSVSSQSPEGGAEAAAPLAARTTMAEPLAQCGEPAVAVLVDEPPHKVSPRSPFEK